MFTFLELYQLLVGWSKVFNFSSKAWVLENLCFYFTIELSLENNTGRYKHKTERPEAKMTKLWVRQCRSPSYEQWQEGNNYRWQWITKLAKNDQMPFSFSEQGENRHRRMQQETQTNRNCSQTEAARTTTNFTKFNSVFTSSTPTVFKIIK